MIQLDKSKGKLYLQIYESIKEDILSGALAQECALPAIRNFAKELGVGVNTVNAAYQNLVADGYIYSVQGSGYYVESLDNVKDAGAEYIEAEDRNYHYDFSYNGIPSKTFPWAQWRKYVSEAILKVEDIDGDSGACKDADMILKRSICRYVKHFRGIDAEPERVVVCAGTLHALDRIKGLLSDFSNGITFLDPCPPSFRNIFRKSSIQIRSLDLETQHVDKQNICDTVTNILFYYTEHYVMERTGFDKNIRFIHEWIESINGYLIQYDKGLTGMIPVTREEQEHMIYIGSFEEIMPQEIKIAYIILPPKLVGRYKRIYERQEQIFPLSYQIALSNFMDDVHLFNMLRKNTYRSKQRKEEFIEIAKKYLGENMEVIDKYAYLAPGLVVSLKGAGDQKQIIKKLKDNSIRIIGAKDYWYSKSNKCGENIYIFKYMNLAKKDLVKVMETMATCLAE